MKKIKIHVSLGLVGCRRYSTIEIEDDLPESEIEEAARDEMFNLIDWGWQEVE